MKESKVTVPEKKKLKLRQIKRLDRFGQFVVDRKLQDEFLSYPFDPQRCLTPTSTQSALEHERLSLSNTSKGSFM